MDIYKRFNDFTKMATDTYLEATEVFYPPHFDGTPNIGDADEYKVGAIATYKSGTTTNLAIYQGGGVWREGTGYTDAEIDAMITAAKNRANHTGTQAINTIEGLEAALDNIGLNNIESISGINGRDYFIGEATRDRSSRFYINYDTILTNEGGHGISDYSKISQVGNGSGYASFDCRPEITGTGDWDHAVGFQSRIVYNGSGSITNRLDAVRAAVNHIGSGSINQTTGVYIYQPQGEGDIVTNVGVYIEPMEGRGENNYAIYTNSGRNRLGDDLEVSGGISSQKITLPNNANAAIEFYGTSDYRINMMPASVGGRIGENTSDFNMYFKMSSANNRGFVFQAGVNGDNVAGIDYLGNSTFKSFRLSDLNIPPSSSSDAGIKGEIRISTGYIYVCIETNTWVRAELTTW